MGTIPAPNIPQDIALGQNEYRDSLDEYNRAAALKQQTALQQQQTQELQLQNQQTQAVNQAYQGAFDTDENGNKVLNPDKLQQSLAQNGHGAAIPGIIKSITDYQSSRADLQKKQQNLLTQGQDALGNLGYALQQANYDPQLAHTIIQDHLNDPALGAQQRAQLTQEQQQIAQNPALIKQLADQWVAQSPKQQSNAIERTKANAQATGKRYLNVNGTLYDLTPPNADKPAPVLGSATTPQDYFGAVNNIVDPKKYPDLNERTHQAVDFYMRQGNIKAANDEITKAQEQIAGIEKDIAVNTNPQIQSGKVAVAAAEGRARADIENRQARGDDPDVKDVPARQVQAARAAALKADNDFAQSNSVSSRLQAMMDDARKGNVVSYQLLPQEGALQVTTSQGVHRINMAEIENYGGGSLWQRMEGHIGKALSGESIPSSVLDDMAEMQRIQQKGSQEKYQNELKGINQRYGSTFKPVRMTNFNDASGTGGGQSTGHKVGDLITQNGHTFKVDQVDQTGKVLAAH